MVARSWNPEWTTELVVLNVLTLLVELETPQAVLLDRIVAGPLTTVLDLAEAGVLPVANRPVAVKRTRTLVQVALALMEDPVGRHWGYELMKRSGVRSGALYPVLQRMLTGGWLSDGWEDPSQIEHGRAPRRYYQVTDKGRRELGAVTADAQR